MTEWEEQAQRMREVPLDARILARFYAERPALLDYRDNRVLPRMRAWSLRMLLYAAVTAAGLLWWGWSPILILVQIYATQWIAWAAEILVLQRMEQRGVTRLTHPGSVDQFADAVVKAHSRLKDPIFRSRGLMIRECMLLDNTLLSEASDRKTASAEAGGSCLWLLLLTVVVVAGMWFAEVSLQHELLSQPLALALLSVGSLWHLRAHYRELLVPPAASSTWNVEFAVGARIIPVSLLSLMAALLQTAADARGMALAIVGLIGVAGAVTLFSLPLYRRNTQRLRHWRSEGG